MDRRSVIQGVTENVDSILFSPMTDDAVRKLSFKKITNPVAFTGLERPTDGGLYDPALGPLDENTLCRSCGQRSFLCPGHCGHIDLVLPVYNPLLFRDLQLILKQTCFYCRQFKMKDETVKIYAKMLECIVNGNIVDARKLELRLTIGKNLKNMLEVDGMVDEMDTSTSLDEILSDNMTECLEDNRWTSLQNDMLKNALNKFWGFTCKKCQNCGTLGPKIRVLDFCWFHMEMNVSDIRGNVLMDKTFNLVDKDSTAIAFGKNVDSDLEGLSRGSSIVQNGEISEDETSGLLKDKKDATDKVLDEFLKQKEFFSGHLLPIQVREILQELWNNEGNILQLIFDIQRHDIYMSEESKSHLMFFMETVLVPANKFRPPSKGGTGAVMEHPQSAQLSKVLQTNASLTTFYANNSFNARTVRGWMDLQETVSVFVDSKKAMRQRDNTGTGISELLEKKAGIFRQKMMGKRVNFACRSVISPDPYLAVNEIGIPPYFALRLTYPERVTPWNVSKLRQYIITGSELHPGATHYLEKSTTVKVPAARNKRVAISRKLSSSRVFAHSERSAELESEGKVVYRHLKDGDIVLVNRQPTLHKPSVMAHVVRVLKGEKTLRMHYANCSTYNADFDGDEMNVHFPQDEISRAEAMNIVNANQQFTVPTSGDPIRGLIQDHIISAVLLTKKDTFLTREEYHQLLYASFVPKAVSNSVNSGWSKKIYTLLLDDEMLPVPPAIWKPKPLWTGKQVITTILNHITRGEQPFTIKKVGTIPRDYFGPTSGEAKLLIRKNELIRGVIDKAQFGKYGLIHSVQELYGSDAAGFLLSILSRLLTGFLQMHGFTCGVDDLLVVKSADKERTSKLTRSENIGEMVYSQFLGRDYGDLDPMKLQSEIERKICSNGESAIAALDRMMLSALNQLTSEVNNDLFPKGLSKSFPSNCLSLMTTTGAKGSLVNLTQISSLLGQQELEGKRVPRMVSGKTLPCFPPWDSSARAGGFICDRFLTGLRPQEYYFHCMAGREGLVDTAVKTSRSGYLQRCLIKNLESLKVCYDHTVRDADGTLIQFCYGEDGVDVHMTSYLSEFKMIADNKEVVQAKVNGRLDDANIGRSNNYLTELPVALKEKAENFFRNIIKKKRDPFKLKRSTFLNLVKFKYLSSLAQPGEAVGVIAAQSVGEPSTQMTLNTFHLAGRGEMNVTLGIPRLQEILMRASEVIQTPVMTCPLLEGKTRVHAEHLAAKLKKVTVADIVESMEVDVLPFARCGMEVGLVYVLKFRLYDPDSYFPHLDITLHDCYKTLVSNFLQKLEDMIKLHVKKFGGITDVVDNAGSDFPEKISEGKSKDESQVEDAESAGVDEDDNADANDDNEDGVDARKSRSQTTDEINYDDDIEKEASMIDFEQDERNMLMVENIIDEAESDVSLGGASQTKKDKNVIFNSEDEADESTSQLQPSSNLESRKEGNIRESTGHYFRSIFYKKNDKLLDFDIEGLTFKACFYSEGEPRILMAKIAQQAASKVYVKSSGRIDRCSVIEFNGDPNRPAIQTAGVNFQVIWGMDDVIDVNNITTNDIHSVLKTYGVEAARATIINEIKGVFGLYGISVNMRHLTLIADYMTVDGGYRPMSRYGIDSSTSPFSKMTFETASQFMKNAALHGEVERLESPSSRICVGLPVKLGTGFFDLMHNLQI